MKRSLKKASAVCAALLCTTFLTVAGSTAVFASSEMNETIQAQVVTIAEGLTTTIIPLTEDEINTYLNSGDEFTIQAMESWNSAKDELGEFEELGSTEVEFSNNQYTVVVPAEFEKLDAEFEYVFDDQGTPTSVSVNVQYPLSVSMTRAGLNTLMGLGVVFVVLIFLCFVIYLLRFVPGLVEGKKDEDDEEEAVVAAAPIPAPAPAAAEAAMDDRELVAIITAAIAASEGKTSTDGYVVRSIRKVNRRKR